MHLINSQAMKVSFINAAGAWHGANVSQNHDHSCGWGSWQGMELANPEFAYDNHQDCNGQCRDCNWDRDEINEQYERRVNQNSSLRRAQFTTWWILLKILLLGFHFKDERSILWRFCHAYNVSKIIFFMFSMKAFYYLDSMMHYLLVHGLKCIFFDKKSISISFDLYNH